jgi:hypothetical protein
MHWHPPPLLGRHCRVSAVRAHKFRATEAANADAVPAAVPLLIRGAVPVALTCRFRVPHAAHGRRTTPGRPHPRYRRTAGVASRRARVRARVGPMLPIGIPSLALISR